MENICFLCKLKEENLDHLLFNCSYAREISQHYTRRVGFEGYGDCWDFLVEWATTNFKGKLEGFYWKDDILCCDSIALEGAKYENA